MHKVPEEPQDFREQFDEANKIENLLDYEPDSVPDVIFVFASDMQASVELEDINSIRSKGDQRISIQVSLSTDLRDEWYEFVELLTGKDIIPGRTGASAPLITLGMRLLMAIVAEFKVEETAKDFAKVLNNTTREKLPTVLNRIAEIVQNE